MERWDGTEIWSRDKGAAQKIKVARWRQSASWKAVAKSESPLRETGSQEASASTFPPPQKPEDAPAEKTRIP